jgi:hypothetical protein
MSQDEARRLAACLETAARIVSEAEIGERYAIPPDPRPGDPS